MALLTLDSVHKSYPDRPLLHGVSLVIEADTRIGIVGANGCGKSTLIRLLAGVETPDEGRRTVRHGLRVGHLLQEVPTHPGTVRDAVRSGLEGRAEVLARLDDIHTELASDLSPDAMDALLAEMARLETVRDHLGGHDVEHRVEALIEHVGLADPEALTASLSGGEQRRVALARVLLGEPDVLLLDEPTNHLDAFVVDWLEDELLRMRTPVIMVTHDRYFLDRVVDRVVEVDRGRLFSYDGGYAGYLRGKEARDLASNRAESGRQSLLRRETAWMRRGPPARSTKAKARIDRYHALLGDAPEATDADLDFRIPPGPRLGTRVVRLRGVTLRFGDRTLVRGLDLDLGNDTRLGIVGPNGAGKTTMLHALIGKRPPDEGHVEIGETVRLAAIDQMRSELDPDATVVEEIAGEGSNVRVGGRAVRIESFLDDFLFPGGRKHTPIGMLSGGERNRVLLAKLLIQGGNVLVLDEPTNDLDLPTLRALEEALLAFEGAVIVVSHDRWFLDRIATEILHLDGQGGCMKFGGSVSTLLERLAADRAAGERAAPPKGRKGRKGRKVPREAPPRSKGRKRGLTNWQRRELDGLPPKIEAAEARLEELAARLADPALYAGPVDEREAVQSGHAEAAAEAERLYARWEELESVESGQSD
jgi:ABC transport system ATP-binding/permease protein